MPLLNADNEILGTQIIYKPTEDQKLVYEIGQSEFLYSK